MKKKFPKIDYNFWLINWNESVGEGKVYTNKNLEKYIKLDSDINACTNEIIELTKNNELSKQTILRVIDLIYSWGGRSSRMFYSKTKDKISQREELENNESTFKKYEEGIELAKKGKTESIEKFNSIRGIGSSYASKHSCFWSINSENPLIIVDSKIAGSLGYKTIDLLEKNPSKVERALFTFHNFYFLNDNSNWKNKSKFNDFDEAQRIANVLFEQ